MDDLLPIRRSFSVTLGNLTQPVPLTPLQWLGAEALWFSGLFDVPPTLNLASCPFSLGLCFMHCWATGSSPLIQPLLKSISCVPATGLGSGTQQRAQSCLPGAGTGWQETDEMISAHDAPQERSSKARTSPSPRWGCVSSGGKGGLKARLSDIHAKAEKSEREQVAGKKRCSRQWGQQGLVTPRMHSLPVQTGSKGRPCKESWYV